MVDIQSATAKDLAFLWLRPRIGEENKESRQKKPQDKNIIVRHIPQGGHNNDTEMI